MHCLGACRQWAEELLQRTASLRRGSGQWNSINASRHCLGQWAVGLRVGGETPTRHRLNAFGAVGSGTPATHRLTARGQWAVGLLQCTASLPGAVRQYVVLQRTASLSGGQWVAQPLQCTVHCLGAVGCGTPATYCPTSWGQRRTKLSCNALRCCLGGSGQRNFCNALLHCLGAVGSATPAIPRHPVLGEWAVELLPCTASLPRVGSGTPAMHRLTASAQWAVGLLQHIASLPGGSGQCYSCNALPHRLRAVDSATRATLCLTVGSGNHGAQRLTVWGQWAVNLLQYTASLLGGTGQWNSRNTPPHCLEAVATETPATHRLTARGQWAMELLQCTAALPRGSREWNSFDTLPHCRGGSGQWNSCNAPPHCLGKWAVVLLQYTASLPGGSGQWKCCNALPHRLGGSGQWISCNALPHLLGVVRSGTPAMHRLTA